MLQRRARRTRRTQHGLIATLLVGTLVVSGCAAFNRGELVLARHVSIGQELIDLKRAEQEGAITEEEFQALKAKIMELADHIEVVHVTDNYVPDQISKSDED